MTDLAGSVPLDLVLANLAASRPVFHSEADLQHAFAWEAHKLDPALEVRLETHPEPNVRLDVLISRPDTGRHTALELKYLTALWAGEVAGEPFALKDHGAQDIRAYDVVKDIARLERLVTGKPGWNGVFLAITNDPLYWRPVTHGRPTNADAFRVYEGVTLTGSRAWGLNTGAGTMKNRTDPIDRAGWQLPAGVAGPLPRQRIPRAVPRVAARGHRLSQRIEEDGMWGAGTLLAGAEEPASKPPSDPPRPMHVNSPAPR